MSRQTGKEHADSPFSIQLETDRGALECLVKQALVDSPFSIQLEKYRGALECLVKQVHHMLILPLASNLRPTEVPWNV